MESGLTELFDGSSQRVIFTFFAFLFGSLLGSFLNVLIYRLPRHESIVLPPSHCPHCGTPIRYRDNIPIVSYLLLRGRCRSCREAITPRYPLVELTTGCMVAAVFWLQGPTYQLLSDIFLAALLITAAMIDLDHMIIPNRLTYPGMFAGMAFSLQWGGFGFWRAFHGAVIGVLIMLFMYFLGKLLYKRESLGMGDIKLTIVIGFFVGPFWTAVVCILAIFSGAVIGIVQLALGKKSRWEEVPFGPFLAFGGLSVIIFREQLLFLIEQYLGMF